MSDESVRRQVMGPLHDGRPPAKMIELSTTEALELLGSVSWGRVVFSQRALPAVRPVNHIVDGGHIVIRIHTGSAILGSAGDGAVVAYEADQLDDSDRTGWSVIVTGTADLVCEPEQLARYESLLQPWLDAGTEHVVRISPDIITAYRLTRDP